MYICIYVYVCIYIYIYIYIYTYVYRARGEDMSSLGGSLDAIRLYYSWYQ